MLLFGAAFVIVTTALYHSLLGERRIIAPLMALEPRSFSQRARRSLRFTWHLAAFLMLLSAAAIAWPGMPTDFVRLVGAFYLLLGIVAFWFSKGRHVSGPLFTAAGLLALAGSA
jgi:hypothetical protein